MKDVIQEEAIRCFTGKCTFNMSMGSGKTLTCLKIIDNFKKVLIVIPKLSVKDSYLKEMEKHKYTYLKPRIKFVTYKSLYKCDYVYDLVVLEEVHNVTLRTAEWLEYHDQKLLGLTGTLPNDYTKLSIINKYCPVTFTYSTDDAVEDNIINDYEINIHYLELNTKKNLHIETKKYNFWTSELQNYQYLHAIKEQSPEFFNNTLNLIRAMKKYKTKLDYTKKLVEESKDKILVFCPTTDICDSLFEHTYHSKNKNSNENLDKFINGEISVLGTVEQLRESINIPNLKYGIIMHAHSSGTNASQKIGRFFRLNPDEKCVVNILCFKDTIDEIWVDKALSNFDKSKIKYINVPKTN